MRSFPTARKLLAAAPFTLVLACSHAPAPRTTSMPSPVVAASTTTAAAAPVAVTPMCDGQGRPLAGNVKRKDARSCTLEERGLLAAAESR